MSEAEKIQLIVRWRKHIADVYARRGREDVYIPLEVWHTCHGCGGGGGRITHGLCDYCLNEYEKLVGKDDNRG